MQFKQVIKLLALQNGGKDPNYYYCHHHHHHNLIQLSILQSIAKFCICGCNSKICEIHFYCA